MDIQQSEYSSEKVREILEEEKVVHFRRAAARILSSIHNTLFPNVVFERVERKSPTCSDRSGRSGKHGDLELIRARAHVHRHDPSLNLAIVSKIRSRMSSVQQLVQAVQAAASELTNAEGRRQAIAVW